MQNFRLTAPLVPTRRGTIIDAPVQVEARLLELHSDLTTTLLRDAIVAGLFGRNEVTRASAPTAAGVQQWFKTVEVLRTSLAMRQWRIHEQQNCPFISSPDQDISIVVMTGNSETGKIGFEDPTNQAEKGTVAENFIQNNNQLELFNRESFKLVKEGAGTQVWALLYHYDKILNEVRFELSLPTGFDNKKITEWGERVILGRMPNNPTDFTINKDEPNSPATVEVKPKIGTF
ncbi:hypothetical protein [Advenella mimigardefordensis]|uniref:Uncharacterized protein n=1 Tax=Advenella mimigardefordensis (strain DSM 17166 / LMG 22922 / DPN7) TaxID=1247726 RepID=W0PIV9_ADVMD|nr:hypothetical protein [Advenella mimigardefordensis]AHG65485.1 hypothetical protein MIM_c34240 [Advenella mimigardefordensis DPN7]